MSNFHSKTFKLQGVTPRLSQPAIAEIHECETRLGAQLPASVREWYSNENAIEILARHSNADPAIYVKDFKVEQSDSKVLLPFKVENQSVCAWCIQLDGSDDPPVLVKVDDDDWKLQARSFSEHVYSCVWDWAVAYSNPAEVLANRDTLRKNDIDLLRHHFSEEVQTYGWPGNTTYRFRGERSAILIWDSDRQADWYIGAQDAEALRKVLRILWNIEGFGDDLMTDSDISNQVLREFRGEA